MTADTVLAWHFAKDAAAWAAPGTAARTAARNAQNERLQKMIEDKRVKEIES